MAYDFCLGFSFFWNQIILKALLVIYVLTLPGMVLMSLLGMLGWLFAAFTGNIGAVVLGVISIGYVLYLVKLTYLNKDSEFYSGGMGAWAKGFVCMNIAYYLLQEVVGIGGRFSPTDIITTALGLALMTVGLYLQIFSAKYFIDPILHGAPFHPLSRFSEEAHQIEDAGIDVDMDG